MDLEEPGANSIKRSAKNEESSEHNGIIRRKSKTTREHQVGDEIEREHQESSEVLDGKNIQRRSNE